jgi:hypothetical protein
MVWECAHDQPLLAVGVHDWACSVSIVGISGIAYAGGGGHPRRTLRGADMTIGIRHP